MVVEVARLNLFVEKGEVDQGVKEAASTWEGPLQVAIVEEQGQEG